MFPQPDPPIPDNDAINPVKQNSLTELNLAHEYGTPDTHLDSEKDTLWYHWTGNIYVKPLRFEAKTGKYVLVLKAESDANLGKHRHRGEVQAYTVSGSWGYQEYDWIAKAGDFVVENPGTIDTLYMGAGSEVMFTVSGSIDFFDDDDSLREIMDGFSFWRMYLEHCEKYGVTPNRKLWY